MPTLTPDEKIALLEKRRQGLERAYDALLAALHSAIQGHLGGRNRRLVAIDAAIERLRKEEHDGTN